MITPTQQRERGQAIVFMVLALIGLLGFAAIALDGGNIYTEQRRAQSAADNAVLAAAYEGMNQGLTATTAISGAAYTSAARNGYNNDRVTNGVTFNSPPKSGVYSGTAGYLEIIITREVPTILAHFVYQGPWRLTVRAIARTHPTKEATPPFAGQAMMSTNTSDCNTLAFSGNAAITITGASIFSNAPPGDCSGTTQNTAGGGYFSNGGSLTLNGGNFGAAGSILDAHNNITSTTSPSATVGGQPQMEIPTDMPIPSSAECGSAQTSPSGTQTINPGTYANGISVGSNKTITLTSGIYCLGADLNLQGLMTTDTNGNGLQDPGEGVLIYFYGRTDPLIDVNAQAVIVLWAMDSGSWKGLALYAPTGPGATDVCPDSSPIDVTINGGGESSIVGTIYMPYCDIKINGGSGTFALYSQIVGYTLDVNGGSGVEIIYDPDLLYALPTGPSSLLVQ